jgi:hypothetical protein
LDGEGSRTKEGWLSAGDLLEMLVIEDALVEWRSVCSK